MLKVKEDILQFIWLNKLLLPKPFVTVSGKEIKVLKTGDLNVDAGPDFFNAQIRIEDLILAGNIEVHVKTSDWLKHGHQSNSGYDNIILHVVYRHDKNLEQNENNRVEVLELSHYIDEGTLIKYSRIEESKEELPCAGQLREVNDLKFAKWLERMTIERLEEKVDRIEQLFVNFKGDFTQTFYTLLLRNFGFKVNALPFEILAKQLPVHLLLKHTDDLIQLEALLLGVSGLLDQQFKDPYIRRLQNEFEYLKNKYHLVVLDKKILKFSRLRPANFPNLRLVEFAKLLHEHPNLFQSPQQYDKSESVLKALKISLSGYWQNHYLPDGEVQEQNLSLGQSSAENLLINTFAPFFFFYSKKLLKPEFGDLALELLQACRFEENKKTKLFAEKKQSLKTGADSQACIQLYDKFCNKKQCLKCGIAASILKPVII